MAKMFYTLDEAAERLGKTSDEVKQMANSGQIQEFRDRDRLMFKVEQIDLLAHDEDSHEGGDAADLSGVIPLADSALDLSGAGLGESSLGESSVGNAASASTPAMGESDLGASGSVIGLEGETGEHMPPGEGGGVASFGEDETSPNLSSGTGSGLLGGLDDLGGSGLLSGSGSGLGASDAGQSGVGIFDADELEEVDAAAMTQMAGGGGSGELNLENLGSGSGLMDLAQESDDTSLGAEFLEEVYPGGDEGADAAAAPDAGGGLFEGGEDEDEVVIGAGGGAMVAAEPYDGAGSGLVGGLMIGAIAALAMGIAFMIIAVLGAPNAGLLDMVADKLMIVVGGLAGATVILGGLGMVIAKKG